MAQPSIQQVMQANAMARAAVLQNGVSMTQQIFNTTVVPANQSVINVVPRNVGLIKGFYVHCTATINNTGGSVANPTNLNIANLLSNITFTDLNNNQRINTSGWHMFMLDSVKDRRPFLSSTASDSPVLFGDIFTNLQSAPASLAATTGTGTIDVWYWVPMAYSDTDLRGAVYANVVNATMNLQLSINTAPGYTTGDPTLAIYGGSGTAVNISSVTVQVYQNYIDQLPQGNQGPILPSLDLATIYEIKNTALSAIVTGQDFPVPYANFRQFLSTFAIYDNGGTLAAGTNINYWSLQTANYTNIFQVIPNLAAAWSRRIMNTDFPAGMYYFDYRGKPISTVQYGNMQLVMNPTGTVNAGATLLVGFEAFANVNTVVGAGSLAAS